MSELLHAAIKAFAGVLCIRGEEIMLRMVNFFRWFFRATRTKKENE
jgi:hypothetical protein